MLQRVQQVFIMSMALCISSSLTEAFAGTHYRIVYRQSGCSGCATGSTFIRGATVSNLSTNTAQSAGLGFPLFVQLGEDVLSTVLGNQNISNPTTINTLGNDLINFFNSQNQSQSVNNNGLPPAKNLPQSDPALVKVKSDLDSVLVQLGAKTNNSPTTTGDANKVTPQPTPPTK